MRALTDFSLEALIDTAVALSVAFGLGAAIGLERQVRQRTAGLRTHVLVAMGAAAFVDLGFDVHGPAGPSQVIAYVVAGIGFLGAGVIMKDGGQVRGLNTAATLWCSAAVGACAGAGQVAQAGVLTLFVLAGNTLLRPLVNAINRRPLDSENSEALYQVHLVCAPSAVAEMRELLFQELEKADYPIQGIELLSETDDSVELAATLVPTTAVAAELDAVVARLEAAPGARSVSWTAGATS